MDDSSALNGPPRDPRDKTGPTTPPSIVSRPSSPYTMVPPIDFDGLSWPCWFPFFVLLSGTH